GRRRGVGPVDGALQRGELVSGEAERRGRRGEEPPRIRRGRVDAGDLYRARAALPWQLRNLRAGVLERRRELLALRLDLAGQRELIRVGAGGENAPPHRTPR